MLVSDAVLDEVGVAESVSVEVVLWVDVIDDVLEGVGEAVLDDVEDGVGVAERVGVVEDVIV